MRRYGKHLYKGTCRRCLNFGDCLPDRFHSQLQGRKRGHVRYKDFVKAMTGTSLTRGFGSDGGGSTRGARNRQKGGENERRRRSSADNIERLVDRLKVVRRSMCW